MTRILPVVALVLALTAAAPAHPGVGILADSKGNVYYTDLSRVWRITPDGRKGIVVDGVHTHELWIDTLDNLYGEHLWYEGDATGKWGHRVWKRSPGGTVTDVIPARPGFRDDYDDFHFVRDRSGAMYWSDDGDVPVIAKRTASGAVSEVLRRPFRRSGAMTVSGDGTIHFVDGDDLVAVGPGGNARTIARGLTAGEGGRAPAFDRNAILGLWTDTSGNVYAAVQARGLVVRITPSGAVSIADRSTPPWKPSGGLVGRNGDLWVLEFSASNAVRVRQVRADGITRIH